MKNRLPNRNVSRLTGLTRTTNWNEHRAEAEGEREEHADDGVVGKTGPIPDVDHRHPDDDPERDHHERDQPRSDSL